MTLNVTPDQTPAIIPPAAADPVQNPEPNRPSTAGMTTKVVKGSIWTLAGQVAPLAVSLIATPFVIRLLGSEGYGVLVLVALIPTYFGFADFGMSIASTKFGSEAFAANDADREGRIVRTAAVIAFLSSMPIAVGIVIASGWIVTLFNVPERLEGEAALALKLAAATFVINFLNGIFNTPQLARLRMDLNTLVGSGGRIIGIIATPIVIYLGGGVLGAVVVLMVASLLTFGGHIYISGRLLPTLFDFTIDRRAIRPLVKFGSALVGAGIAGLLLANIEKGILPWLSSVRDLAYYSVAFTVASMLTMFSSAMSQSLLPAFSQLQGIKDRERLNGLFSRAVKINLIWLVPAIAILTIIGKPFLTVWAGKEFGENGAGPFYVLLVGLTFHILTYLPYTLIIAAGRTDILAKIYWCELIPYLIIAALLIRRFGAMGAAAAWSIRIVVDNLILFITAHKLTYVSLSPKIAPTGLIAAPIMLIPFSINLFFDGLGVVTIASTGICMAAYCYLIWKIVLDKDEVAWLTGILKPQSSG